MNLAARGQGQGLGQGSAPGQGLGPEGASSSPPSSLLRSSGQEGMELQFGEIYDHQDDDDHTHGVMVSPMHTRVTQPAYTHNVNPSLARSQASPPYQYPHRSPSHHPNQSPSYHPSSGTGAGPSPGLRSGPHSSPGPGADASATTVISSISPRPKTDRRPQSSPSALVSPSQQV